MIAIKSILLVLSAAVLSLSAEQPEEEQLNQDHEQSIKRLSEFLIELISKYDESGSG